MLLLVILALLSYLNLSGASLYPQSPLRSVDHRDESASDGCQLASLPHNFRGKDIKLYLPFADHNRTFRVFIPKSYRSGVATPLILSFHGRGKTAAQQQKLAGFSTDSDPAYNPGWIVVTPQGVKRAWEGAPYAEPTARDVDFTGYLLDYLEQNLCIDKSRIYAAGKSNGGGFVGKLACSKLSARIAAYAPVSGAFYTNVSVPCNPTRPLIPIIDFHGMADCVIPYSGGDKHGFYLDSIPSVLRAWATRQDCKDPMDPTNIVKHEKFWKTSWSCGNGHEETIVAYNITGLKHAWPSKYPNNDSAIPTIMNATPHIIKFFSAWTLPGPV